MIDSCLLSVPDVSTHVKHFMTPGGPDAKPVYDLCGVVLHLDLMNISSFGHYVAFLRQDSGEWWANRNGTEGLERERENGEKERD